MPECIKLKIWEKAFETWLNFCPFVKRELISKKRFLKWAESLKLIRTFDKDHFFIFMKFLEDCHIICPLTVGTEKFNFQYDKFFYYNNTFNEPLYHPIQFFEILNWFKFRSLRRRPYFYNEKYNAYLNYNLIKYQIKERESEIERTKKMGIHFKGQEDYLEKLKEKLESLEIKTFPEGLELLKYVVIGGTSNIFSEDYLSLWIKLESLCLQEDARIFSHNPPKMLLTIKNNRDKKEAERCIHNFRQWFNNIKQNPLSIFKKEDSDKIRNFHHFLGTKIRNGDFSKDHWDDLFDIILPRKKDKLSGITSYYINLLSIKRYLERANWLLFKKNIVYGRELDYIPHFYYYNDEEKYYLYKKSVLLDFELFTKNPFLLYVEGQSDFVIINEFLNNHRGWNFRVKNMSGAEKSTFFEKIHEQDNDQHYYFFDFDTNKDYEKRKRLYSGKASFFFPDFMTENFEVNEIIKAFKCWISRIKLPLKEVNIKEISDKLEFEKLISNNLIRELETTGQINNERNTKGYEDIIIRYLKQHFPKELSILFPNKIQLDSNGWIKNSRSLVDIVKKELSNRLKLIVSYKIKKDPKRESSLFPFEKKLEPFGKKMEYLINHRYKELKKEKL